MKRWLVCAILVCSISTLACDPIVMIPGGALSGSVVAHPTSWDFTNAVDTVQLETRPDDPYSVNIWCVAVGEALYIAGSRSSTWTQNVADDGRVRLRVEGKLYELRAIEATEEAEFDGFASAAKAKYDFEPEPGQREESILFRLARR